MAQCKQWADDIIYQMKRTISWVNKTEARDKLCKAIQYASRIIKFEAALRSNKDLQARFNGLFTGMRDARKLFRLLKSVNELQKLLEVLNSPTSDQASRALNVLIRICFMLYWAFDNLGILSQIKFIGYDTKSMNRWAASFWFWALFCTVLLKIHEVYKLFKSKKGKEIDAADRLKLGLTGLQLIKAIGDMAPAGMGSGYFPERLGINLSDRTIGAGGLVSAIITSWQLYD